ncbi:hypothetical protein CEW92_09425 [Bacillaceae bacterium SAS-127]|nr:hypothetical protein CEW92_09425 [Bacillaceae bacterium SAS-127]
MGAGGITVSAKNYYPPNKVFIEEIESQIGLSEFMDDIKSDKVVNPNLSREASNFHNGILQDRMRLSGDVAYAGQVSAIINKAFKLGLVGNDQELIKKYI